MKKEENLAWQNAGVVVVSLSLSRKTSQRCLDDRKNLKKFSGSAWQGGAVCDRLNPLAESMAAEGRVVLDIMREGKKCDDSSQEEEDSQQEGGACREVGMPSRTGVRQIPLISRWWRGSRTEMESLALEANE